MRRTARLLCAFRRLWTDWLYCLLQGLLSLVNIAFWLAGVVVSPVLALVLGPRLVAVAATCVNWLADLNVLLLSWRQRPPTGMRLDTGPRRRHSAWTSMRCVGVNALSLPVHVVAVFLFPVTLAWAPVHGRLLGWALAEPLTLPASEPDRRAGHGLVGMRERVRALGGTLVTEPDDQGGFRVLAVLPLNPAPDATAPVDPDPVDPDPVDPDPVDTETTPTSPEGLAQEDS